MRTRSEALAKELVGYLKKLGLRTQFLRKTDDGACWISSEADSKIVGICMERLRNKETSTWYGVDVLRIARDSNLSIQMFANESRFGVLYYHEVNAENSFGN